MIYLPDTPSLEDLREFYANYGSFKGQGPRTLAWTKRRILWWRNPLIRILEESGGLKGMRFCEVGCGDGAFLQLARARGAEVYGAEADRTAVEHLRGFSIPVTVGEDDTNHYDVVCAFQLLEHITDMDLLVRWLSRVLIQDGRFLLTVPNGEEGYRVGSSWVGYRVDMEHMNYFSVGSLSRLLGRSGILIEHYWEYGQPSIQRARPMRPEGSRISRLLRRLLDGCLGANVPQPSHGRYHLAVLGRRV